MFAPRPKFAQVPAMISPQNNDRVLAQVEPVQFIEYLADLRVHVTHRGAVGVPELAAIVLILQRALRDMVLPDQLKAWVKRNEGVDAVRHTWEGDGGNFPGIIQIPVFLRRVERQVRFVEADGQSELLALELSELGDSRFG